MFSRSIYTTSVEARIEMWIVLRLATVCLWANQAILKCHVRIVNLARLIPFNHALYCLLFRLIMIFEWRIE